MCVGVQKGATSTLHDILVEHPELTLPRLKETHYFRDDEKYNKGVKHYFSYYFADSKKKLTGEIDPEYCYFPKCAERIKQTFGSIKIVFIVRNPVDRAYSHYLMTKRRGLETLSFENAIKQERERLKTHYDHIHFSYISRGFYCRQIERYEELFGKENVKIVLFEDLIKNTKAVVDDISSFVGLSAFEFNYNVKSNPASEAKSKLIREFIYQPNRLKRIVGKIIPSKKMKDAIMFLLNKKNLKPAITEKLKINFKQTIYHRYFVNEIEALETKLKINLSSWKY